MDKITHVVCSPLLRAIMTTLIGFKPIFQKGIKAIAWEQLREWGSAPCGTGTPLNQLEELVGGEKSCLISFSTPPHTLRILSIDICELGLGIDLQLLSPGWELNKDRRKDRAIRVKNVKKELLELGQTILHGGEWNGIDFRPFPGDEDIDILVVSHGGFLSYLLGGEYMPLFQSPTRRMCCTISLQSQFPNQALSLDRPTDHVFRETRGVLQHSIQILQIRIQEKG